MSSPPLSLNRSDDDNRSPSPESNASHDRSESESPRQTPGLGSGNNSTSASKRQTRRGYYEDAYGAYPPTDEDREGGSVPCESDSDEPPTLSARVRHKKQSKRATVKSRRQEERAQAAAFGKRLTEYDPNDPCGETSLEDDAKLERAHVGEKTRLEKMRESSTSRTTKRSTFGATQGKYGMFGRAQPTPRKSNPCEKAQEASSAESTIEDQEDDDAKDARAEFRRGKTFRQYMEELDHVFKSSSRLPNPYRQQCRWWKRCGEHIVPEKVAWHRRHMKELLHEGGSEDSPPLSSPPSTTPERPSALPSPLTQSESSQNVSMGTKGFVDPRTGEITIPLSVLKAKYMELTGDLDLTNEASNGGIPYATKDSSDTPKRFNEGPPKDGLELPAKKLRKDSGASRGEIHGMDVGLADNGVYETSLESRDSSVQSWVRRSDRPASNSKSLYRADQHTVDKFLDSSPKVQDESTSTNVVDSDGSVVRWSRAKSLPRPTTPLKLKKTPAVSPGTSGTPKRRGRMPGSRVINGKVVLPSEESTHSAPKSFTTSSPKVTTTITTITSKPPEFNLDEPMITKKRTPTSSEKVRAKSIHAAATKKAPAQSRSSKTGAHASNSKTQTSASSPENTDTQPNSAKADKNPAKRKPSIPSIAAPARTRSGNSSIRGKTDFEEESNEAATTRNDDDAGEREVTFHLPPRRPTPPYPESSGLLNSRLFR